MESWLNMVTDVGFPVVVTLYLLHRIEGKLDDLNHSVQMLPQHINRGTTFHKGTTQDEKLI